jgi:hypothetical protein
VMSMHLGFPEERLSAGDAQINNGTGGVVLCFHMTQKIKTLIVVLAISCILVSGFYIYFINKQAKNGSILIEKGSFTDFLIFDKTGMKYYSPSIR